MANSHGLNQFPHVPRHAPFVSRRAELVVGCGRFAVGAAAQELEDDLGGAVRRGRVQLVAGAHLADAIAGAGRGGQEGAWEGDVICAEDQVLCMLMLKKVVGSSWGSSSVSLGALGVDLIKFDSAQQTQGQICREGKNTSGR